MGKKVLIIFLLAMLLAAAGQAAKLSVGAMAGMTIPIIQEDQSSGMVYGLKGKLSLIPGIAVEPNLYFAKQGDGEFEFGTIPGSKITSYGLDAILGGGQGGGGFSLYGVAGIGMYSITRDVATFEDISKFGFTVGLGMEIGIVPAVGLDIRGKMDVINAEGGGSKKSAAVLGGLNYYFGL